MPQAFQLLREMNESVQQVTQLVDNMLARVKRGEISTDKVSLNFQEYLSALQFILFLLHVIAINLLPFVFFYTAGFELFRNEVSHASELPHQPDIRCLAKVFW